MSKNNGGPAFPRPAHTTEDEYGRKETIPAKSGMTLRDYFAAKAMQGMLSHHAEYIGNVEQLARDAYAAADAMLAERELEK